MERILYKIIYLQFVGRQKEFFVRKCSRHNETFTYTPNDNIQASIVEYSNLLYKSDKAQLRSLSFGANSTYQNKSRSKLVRKKSVLECSAASKSTRTG
jgi:hypothetical protein